MVLRTVLINRNRIHATKLPLFAHWLHSAIRRRWSEVNLLITQTRIARNAIGCVKPLHLARLHVGLHC